MQWVSLSLLMPRAFLSRAFSLGRNCAGVQLHFYSSSLDDPSTSKRNVASLAHIRLIKASDNIFDEVEDSCPHLS
eukprot:764199-Hanusia_phi.AAC.3